MALWTLDFSIAMAQRQPACIGLELGQAQIKAILPMLAQALPLLPPGRFQVPAARAPRNLQMVTGLIYVIIGRAAADRHIDELMAASVVQRQPRDAKRRPSDQPRAFISTLHLADVAC